MHYFKQKGFHTSRNMDVSPIIRRSKPRKKKCICKDAQDIGCKAHQLDSGEDTGSEDEIPPTPQKPRVKRRIGLRTKASLGRVPEDSKLQESVSLLEEEESQKFCGGAEDLRGLPEDSELQESVSLLEEEHSQKSSGGRFENDMWTWSLPLEKDNI